MFLLEDEENEAQRNDTTYKKVIKIKGDGAEMKLPFPSFSNTLLPHVILTTS